MKRSRNCDYFILLIDEIMNYTRGRVFTKKKAKRRNEKMEKKNNKGLIIGAIVLVLLVAVFAVVYKFNKPATHAGSKEIVIEVKGSDGNAKEYELSTDAEYLIQAMDELVNDGSGFTYQGTDSDYGMMIEYINDERAIYAEDGAYWALYVNGEYGMAGASEQPVADGDTFTWAYELAQ